MCKKIIDNHLHKNYMSSMFEEKEDLYDENTKTRAFVLCCMTGLVFLSMFVLASSAEAETYTLTILHTNDHHGHFATPFRHSAALIPVD